ncbi:hypothetical protein UlMin_034250 [Ulmus minor]
MLVPPQRNDTSIQQNTEEIQPPHVPVIQREPLYARFGKMKPAEFAGSTDPLEVEEWISSMETILDFMQLNDQERTKNTNKGSKPNYKPNQSSNLKKKGKPSGQGSQSNQSQRRNSQNYPPCKKCGKPHPGEYRAGNPNICYRCGKEGHYVRKCPNPPNYGNVTTPNNNSAPKAYSMQAKLEVPSISQG